MITSYFALQSPMLVAHDRGFFAAEGLDVEYVRATSSTQQTAYLLDGRTDVAQTAADNVFARTARNQCGVRIFHVSDLGLDQFVVAGLGVATWDEVRGGHVGVDAPDSGYAFIIYRMLHDAGVGGESYETVPLGGPHSRFEALISGEIRAGLLNPVLTEQARAEGLVVLGRGAQHFPVYPNLVFAATESYAAEHRDELDAYGRAMRAATVWANDAANRAELIELVAHGRELPIEVAQAAVEIECLLRSNPDPSDPEVRAALDVVARLRQDMTGTLIPVDDVVFPWACPRG